MSDKDILPLMVKDHCKLEKLLGDLEEKSDEDYLSRKDFRCTRCNLDLLEPIQIQNI